MIWVILAVTLVLSFVFQAIKTKPRKEDEDK